MHCVHFAESATANHHYLWHVMTTGTGQSDPASEAVPAAAAVKGVCLSSWKFFLLSHCSPQEKTYLSSACQEKEGDDIHCAANEEPSCSMGMV